MRSMTEGSFGGRLAGLLHVVPKELFHMALVQFVGNIECIEIALVYQRDVESRHSSDSYNNKPASPPTKLQKFYNMLAV